MLYGDVIMWLLLLVCAMLILVFLWFVVLAVKEDNEIFAIVGFLAFICAIIMSLPSLEYFGIVQLSILQH